MMSCKNNLKQIGIAIHLHHDTMQVLPSGWVANANDPDGDPGWGWGAMLIPYLEEANLYEGKFSPKRSISDPLCQSLRESPIPVFICPSELDDNLFWLPEEDGSHDHEAARTGGQRRVHVIARRTLRRRRAVRLYCSLELRRHVWYARD